MKYTLIINTILLLTFWNSTNMNHIKLSLKSHSTLKYEFHNQKKENEESHQLHYEELHAYKLNEPFH